jgi:excisionase family DNA binding protein
MANTQRVSETRVISLIKDIKNLLTNEAINDKWMNINKASKYCDVSSATLRRNVHKNTLKASQATGKMLFKQSELEKWLTKEEK